MATFSDVCWSGLVSAGTPSFVLRVDPTTVTPALSSSSAQFYFRMLNAKSREERKNLELRLCELLLGSTLLSGHDFFSRVCSRGERERERERERESRLTAGVNFIFSGFLNDPRRDKRDSKCR